MTEQNVPNLVINKVESQEVYDAMATAGEINANELYFVAGGGGPLIVETELYNGGTYQKGWTTVEDADDMVNAFISGRQVIVHFIEYEGYAGGEEKYASVVAYQPSPGSNAFEIYFDYNVSNAITDISRTQSGKFQIEFYVD